MKEDKKKVRIDVLITKEQKKKLKQRAKKEEVSEAEIIRNILEEAL